MLWRMPADTHEQRIGIMSTAPAFIAHLQLTTSVSATRVFPRGPRPRSALPPLDPASLPVQLARISAIEPLK
jgi:hypothetical protein